MTLWVASSVVFVNDFSRVSTEVKLDRSSWNNNNNNNEGKGEKIKKFQAALSTFCHHHYLANNPILL